MRYHPAQANQESLKKISQAFRERMIVKGLLPKNPWKCKRTEEWLARMGARMEPGDINWMPWPRVEADKFFNFKVDCLPSKVKIRGRRGYRFLRIEIPWELADKILVLGRLL